MARIAPLLLSLALATALGAVSACTSTDATMGILPPSPVASIPIDPGSVPMSTTAAMPRQQTAVMSSPQSTAEVQFLPIIGAPADKIAQLAEALSRNAASSGIGIRPSDGPVTPLRLKGYFSALNDGSQTIVVYVWDVLDATDTRVNRIQGQEAIPGAVGEPWSAVGPAMLNAIAARTMQETARLSASLG